MSEKQPLSLLDRMLGTQRTKKSFLLRKKNVNGCLCVLCHKSEKERDP